jgi:hypothetical protein
MRNVLRDAGRIFREIRRDGEEEKAADPQHCFKRSCAFKTKPPENKGGLFGRLIQR